MFKPFFHKRYILTFLLLGTILVGYVFSTSNQVNFWDTGEFITASHTLSLSHAPGAPFYLMLNLLIMRLTELFLDPAFASNLFSAVLGGMTGVLVYQILFHLSQSVLRKGQDNISKAKEIMAILASASGSLTIAFSDTYWHIATKTEVYSLALFFMVLIIRLGIQWQKHADSNRNKYLLLIALLAGLGFATHWMTLLSIPVIGLMLIHNYWPLHRFWQYSLALLAVLILFYGLFFLIRQIPELLAQMDLLFVNILNLPIWSGAITGFGILLGILSFLTWKLKRSWQKGYALLGACLSLFLIGYSAYAMVPIRSNADAFIDFGAETPFELAHYMNREAFKDRPLLHGHFFSAYEHKAYQKEKSGKALYSVKGGQYIKVSHAYQTTYDKAFKTFFPRLYSTKPGKIHHYRDWLNLNPNEDPDFTDNLEFFFEYQVGHMYWRYFAWNFIGRQNDFQGNYLTPEKGNWITGFSNLDQWLSLELGAEWLPAKLRDNPARNPYYCLPFFIGLLGFIYQFRQDRANFFLILTAFLMTGLALVVFINMPPDEARERDYIFAGSFVFFSIWVGLGILAILTSLWQYLSSARILIGSSLLALGIPTFMVLQGWTDHKAVQNNGIEALGRNYLNTCDSNAILLTDSDNNTSMLWYLQAVKGIREDVHVANAHMFLLERHIKGLKEGTKWKQPLPFTYDREQYQGNRLNYTTFHQLGQSIDTSRHHPMTKVLQFIGQNNGSSKIRLNTGMKVNYFPTRKWQLPHPQPDTTDKPLTFKLDTRVLAKNELMLFDMIRANQWEQPIYFTKMEGNSVFNSLKPFLEQTGILYRLTPEKHEDWSPLPVNVKTMYDHLIKKYQWGRFNEKRVYPGKDLRDLADQYRDTYINLGNALLKRNRFDSAVKVMDKGLDNFPAYNLPWDYRLVPFVQIFYRAKAPEKGKALAKQILPSLKEWLTYYAKLPESYQAHHSNKIQKRLGYLQTLLQLANQQQQKQKQWQNQLKSNLFHFKKEFAENL